LRKIRKLENEILTNDAYGNKNLKTRLNNLERLGADEETINMIKESHIFKKKLRFGLKKNCV